MSSVRFICGTQEEHTELETKLSLFLGFEDAILYSICFDANAGLSVFGSIVRGDTSSGFRACYKQLCANVHNL